MSRQVSVASMTLGVMALIGGVCAMVFGGLDRSAMVKGLGPLDGFWSATEYFTIGAVLAVVGGGVFTFGFLNRTPKTGDLR